MLYIILFFSSVFFFFYNDQVSLFYQQTCVHNLENETRKPGIMWKF